MKWVTDLEALVKQRTWDKEVLLWRGSEMALNNALGSVKFMALDLLDLFHPDNLPPDDDSTKELMTEQLRYKLRSIPKGPENRVVLVVKSIGLLARYRVGLKEFYDWFVRSYTILVLLLEDTTEKFEWPDEVWCDPNRLTGFFAEPGMVKEIYTSTGELYAGTKQNHYRKT